MSEYKCMTCGASGCKLWRPYQTFDVKLACVRCALAQQKQNGPVDAKGLRPSDWSRTDQIGWMVPAVPAGPGAYWGYTSVPETDAQWWRELPTYPARVVVRWGQPGRHRRRKNRQAARALEAIRQGRY